MPTRYQAINDEPVLAGEGITRTSNPKAKLWPVTITFVTGMRPLRETIRARGPLQAEQFARARYPHARTVAVGNKPSAVLS